MIDGLRKHLLELLDGRSAHANHSEVLTPLPSHLQGKKPEGAVHSPWEVLEHLRIAQWDILEFSRNKDHRSPDFPKGYWPEGPSPPDKNCWEASTQAFKADLQAVKDLVVDPTTDLLAPIPHGTGQTILREALLVADHNAYHLGEMVLLRRLLGGWPD